MKLPRTLGAMFTLAALTGAPASAFASSVEITELMYDTPNSDTNREWIEVTNKGTSSIDLSSYKLFEGDTTHALTSVSGGVNLAPGASAVLVEDAAKFSADWPGVSSPLLKASFSLSNTGETLSLKDSTLTVVDQVTYDSSKGAAGDGNSLHRSGSGFVVGAADPGVYSQTIPQPIETPNTTSTDSNTNSQTQASAAQNSNVPAITAKITADTTVIVGAGSFFTASALNSKGEKIPDARFIWNFGDGATSEGQNVFHTYEYPGKYSVMLSIASNLSAGIAKVAVQAVPAQIALMTESDGSTVLVNRANQELSVGLWSITSGTSTFVIPTGTSVLAGQSVRFAPNVMHMHADSSAVLQYPNGVQAVAALPHEVPPEVVSTPIQTPTAAQSPKPVASKIASRVVLEPVPEQPEVEPDPAPAQPAPGAFLPFSDIEVPAVTPTPAASKPTVQAKQEVPADARVASAATAVKSPPVPFWEGVLGVAALVILGLSGVWYSKGLVAGAQTPTPRRNSFSVDEFDIEG